MIIYLVYPVIYNIYIHNILKATTIIFFNKNANLMMVLPKTGQDFFAVILPLGHIPLET